MHLPEDHGALGRVGLEVVPLAEEVGAVEAAHIQRVHVQEVQIDKVEARGQGHLKQERKTSENNQERKWRGTRGGKEERTLASEAAIWI